MYEEEQQQSLNHQKQMDKIEAKIRDD